MSDPLLNPCYIVMGCLTQEKYRTRTMRELASVVQNVQQDLDLIWVTNEDGLPYRHGKYIRVGLPWIMSRPKLAGLVRHKLAINALTK